MESTLRDLGSKCDYRETVPKYPGGSDDPIGIQSAYISIDPFTFVLICQGCHASGKFILKTKIIFSQQVLVLQTGLCS